ncbi:cyclic peptide export ABC transporter [Photobacterium minamisatsumaniensis]|uniref:cyclic peptide export ABC transporter n=1 Tax=Photobacterium minamisatsumaniensis TaxID=2910233 RepID=UPI003D11D456
MGLKKISDLYWRTKPNLFFLSVLLGVVTGICYSLLIPFIIYATNSDRRPDLSLEVENFHFFASPTADLAIVFLATCLGIIVIKSTSYILSAIIAHHGAVAHRIEIYKKINNLPYVKLEEIGQARLINLLNVDIKHITLAATSLPLVWISLITIIGTLGYLVYLDIKVFSFVLMCLIGAILTYQLPIWYANRYLTRSREQYDRVQQGVRGLILGAKELKLSAVKTKTFTDKELVDPEEQALNAEIKGLSILTFTQVYGEIIAFLVIGVVVFHLPYQYPLGNIELFGIVMALLYLTGPVAAILTNLEHLQKGRVALRKLQDFYRDLDSEESAGSAAISPNWSALSLNNVSYRYPGNNSSFALNNISLIFNKGEITFIIGGNGSGKSTLSKIISLHYQPTQGHLFLSEQLISNNNLACAREKISAIYTDYHLFPELYGQWNNQKINEYLRYLELDNKVKIINNRFSTTLLSDGQKKRLALLSLLLEDRNICLFDEWAADQDPRFKDIFYRIILPDLKQQGKVVIVISHDDRYFDCADKVVVMDQGSIREITTQLGKQLDITT